MNCEQSACLTKSSQLESKIDYLQSRLAAAELVCRLAEKFCSCKLEAFTGIGQALAAWKKKAQDFS